MNLESIEVLKQQGNNFFLQQHYEDAKLSYSEAIAELGAPMKAFQNSGVQREIEVTILGKKELVSFCAVKDDCVKPQMTSKSFGKKNFSFCSQHLLGGSGTKKHFLD